MTTPSELAKRLRWYADGSDRDGYCKDLREAAALLDVREGWVSVSDLTSIIEKMRRCDYQMALSDLLGLAAKGEGDG